jgi:hypothetical protein
VLYSVAVLGVLGWIVFEAVARILVVSHAIGTRHHVLATECHTEHYGRGGGHEACSGVWTDGAGHTHRVAVDGPVGSTHDVYVWLGRSSDQRVAAFSFLAVALLLVFIAAAIVIGRRSAARQAPAEAAIADDTAASPPT